MTTPQEMGYVTFVNGRGQKRYQPMLPNGLRAFQGEYSKFVWRSVEGGQFRRTIVYRSKWLARRVARSEWKRRQSGAWKEQS